MTVLQALHNACLNGNIDGVKELLPLCNNPNDLVPLPEEQDPYYTALHAACKHGHPEVVRLLLADPRINVNAENKKGLSPLITACHYGQAAVVEVLLERDAVIRDFRGHDGANPFYHAVRGHGPEEEREKTIDLLLGDRFFRRTQLQPVQAVSMEVWPEIAEKLKQAKDNPLGNKQGTFFSNITELTIPPVSTPTVNRGGGGGMRMRPPAFLCL